MSSDLPSGDPTAAAERGAERPDAHLVRLRGQPLLEALERRFPAARDHAESSAAYAFAAAVELGLPRETCELVREAARLHEIGQVYASGTPAFGGHQEDTYKLAHGAAIDEEVCSWLLHARERFDGHGPGGLEGAAIPVESRLIRAACAFHAAIVDPSADPSTPGHVRGVDRVRSEARAELDPEAVAALVAVVQRAAV